MAIIGDSGNEKARWETALQERKDKEMTRGSDYETSAKVEVRGVITRVPFSLLLDSGKVPILNQAACPLRAPGVPLSVA
ncbi:hypothetical protein [uncultured Azohydromonas sp.]|jgi:hypothetical protein|uniref:hypothetical protein n=1 Tax=uncultured Azohydromonas sp. TaxID=487342 RepID=UPI0026166977|nr:hypothetical protein [uncultured Azohydromonas sp.]